MDFQFAHHYTLDEARSLLPSIREWLEQLRQARSQLQEYDQKLSSMLALGDDIGGPTVNAWVRTLGVIKTILSEFQRREIQLKDLERGLVDFPSIRNGVEVFLCWEQDEDDIEFWHDLDSGYAGRDRI